ncbi:Wzz/FepE/Etk N-terminal domain-containing protein [Streptosporangium sp. NPDC020072]|uniref:Wzz/FepE/Etk N-terminal domain-containing protein n=1 Tax=Streptosporangium sp. NPDC020072 TaxID=3154788 RepID=UPI00341C5449
MSPPPDASVRRSGGDLTDYVSFLRRRWPTILFLLAGGAGAGAVLLCVIPPSYTASAQVLVTPTGLQEQTNQVTNRQREALNLDTEAQVAQSAVVARKAGRTLGGTPGPVEVSVPPNTSVLDISYTASDPAAAAAGAGAYARAYLDNRREAAARAMDAQLGALQSKLKQVNASLSAVVASLPSLPKGTAERTLAAQRQNVLGRQVYNLTVKYDALRTVAVTPGTVISEAVPPAAPSQPSPPLYLGSGLMAGLLTGVGLAWLRDRPARQNAPATGGTGPGAVLRARPEEIERLAGEEGAVLLVSVAGISPRGMARAVRRLGRQGMPVVGGLLTPPPPPQRTVERPAQQIPPQPPQDTPRHTRSVASRRDEAPGDWPTSFPVSRPTPRSAGRAPESVPEPGRWVAGASMPTVPIRTLSPPETAFPP